MTAIGWAQIAIVLALTLATAIPLSSFIASVYSGERKALTLVLRPVEIAFYRLAGVDEKREQSWLTYAFAMIAFSIAGFICGCISPVVRLASRSSSAMPSTMSSGSITLPFDFDIFWPS